jgi:hypothetical protein
MVSKYYSIILVPGKKREVALFESCVQATDCVYEYDSNFINEYSIACKKGVHQDILKIFLDHPGAEVDFM